MDSLVLIAVYIGVAAVLQLAGFGVSRVVDYEFPTAGLLTFLAMFLSAFFLAWPIAVRAFEKIWGHRTFSGETDSQAAARRSGKRIDSQTELDRRPTAGARV
jgi:hypothetical protein